MWLEKCGFIDVRIVDACVTSTEEQRRTEWMTTESLADFLDPQDQRKTVEGYPAPAARGDYCHQTGNPAVAGKKSEIKKAPV
jgi:hypothetical protein